MPKVADGADGNAGGLSMFSQSWTKVNEVVIQVVNKS